MLEESKIDKLLSEAKDSKTLTKDQRENLYKKYIKSTKYKIIIINPEEIDEALNSPNTNLNWLEAQKSAEIINELKPDKAILDSPSPNLQAYKDYIKKLIKTKTKIITEHKAEKYPIVAAASIIAKVTRDKEIEKITKKNTET